MRIAIAALALIAGVYPNNLQAACTDGTQPSGAKYRICLPSGVWNRQLVVYAHGYVSPDQPVAIPEDHLSLPDGTSLPDTFNLFGYAFAASSYRTNGLAVLDGVNDIKELTEIFNKAYGKPDATFLGGVSEGGLITALSAEKFPNIYDGAVAACGPIGNFSGQINYMGDVRNLFDYFFPGVLPGTVVSVPASLWTNWDSVYVPAIKSALASNPAKQQAFLNTSLIPKAADPAGTVENIVGALRYSAMATNDARMKLKGQPYENTHRLYFGSTNDFLINIQIPRYTADPAAVQQMKLYETTGKPLIPLVTLHTIADPIVPWLHETGYFIKAFQTGSVQRLTQIPVFRNGHCNFEPAEVLWAFLVMLGQKSNTPTKTMLKSLTESQLKMLPAEVQSGARLP